MPCHAMQWVSGKKRKAELQKNALSAQISELKFTSMITIIIENGILLNLGCDHEL